MFVKKSDKEWEKFGSKDPYFGVLSTERYHSDQLNDDSLEAFFTTRREHVQHVLALISNRGEPGFRPKRALDFGCRVGRIAIPLAQTCERVTGVDVSESMLKEAAGNARRIGVDNLRLTRGTDSLEVLEDEAYDFIHSFIVFQHIPPNRGIAIARRLLAHLSDDGVAALHFTFDKSRRLGRLRRSFRHIPLAQNFYHMIKGRSFFYPQIQMNTYNMNELLSAFFAYGMEVFTSEFVNHHDNLGVFLFIRRRSDSISGTRETQ